MRDGAALGTWGLRRVRGRAEVRIKPFEPLAPDDLSAIEAEAADVGRFEGLDSVLVPSQ